MAAASSPSASSTLSQLSLISSNNTTKPEPFPQLPADSLSNSNPPTPIRTTSFQREHSQQALARSQGSQLSSSADRNGHVPPYWHAHQRTVSNLSYQSISGQIRPVPIVLEDRTEQRQSQLSGGLWAKGVRIEEHSVVSGMGVGMPMGLGAGSYVVWHCVIEVLEGGELKMRKRYSEFDDLRSRLLQTFPHSEGAIPALPPKSMISRFRPQFLEKRREGLAYFLNCVILNPEFAGSPVLRDFVFS